MREKTKIFVEWVATALAIIGAIMNAFLIKEGFYLWIVSNGIFMVFSLKNKHYGMSLMFFVYLIITIIGIFYWK